MKKNIIIVNLLLWGIFTHNLQAQESCNGSISPSTLPLCQMTYYPSEKPVETGETDCMKACKGGRVDYTASVQAGDSCIWAVNGATSSSVINGGHTLRVVWNYGAGGMIWLTVITADGHVCAAEQCIELIESPVAQSVSFPAYMPADNEKIITVCKGQEVRLEERSTAGSSAITGSLWSGDFGNGEGDVFLFTAHHEGKVEHKVINDCGCESTETYRIVLRQGLQLELSCYGTACEGSSASYKLLNAPLCAAYNWVVEGGDIVSGQGHIDIAVQWGSPESGYGTLTVNAVGCEKEICPIVYRIPIITDEVPISGETNMCVGAHEVYEVPLWGATKYTWTVLEPSGYIIRDIGMANQFWLEFTEQGTYTINVTYSCDFLDCNFKKSQNLIINIKPRITITGDKESICKGDTASFWAEGNETPLTWRIYRQNQLFATQTGVTLTYVFNTAGNYRIEADASLYCKASSAWLTVKAPPAPVDVVSGPHEACPNSGIMMRSVCPPGYILEWESPYMVDSNLLSRGNVSIHFGDSVGDIKVYQIDALMGCRSEAYLHHVELLELLDAGLPESMSVCEGDVFKLSAPKQEHVTYQWIIGNSNLAGFWKKTYGNKDTAVFQIRSQGVDVITVMQFDIKLVRTMCNSQTDTAVVTIIDTIFPAPNFTLSHSTVCAGDTVIAQIINPLPNVPYWWVTPEGEIIYNTPTLTLSFSPDTVFICDVQLFYQPLPECYPRGRKQSYRINPRPSLFLTWGDYGDYFHITSDARQGQNYEWKRDNVVISGQTESGLYDHIPGQYCCNATNQYGCVNSACITIPTSAISAPSQSGLQMSLASNPPVPLPLIVTVSCNTATISNSLGIPADSLMWTSQGEPGMVIRDTVTETASIWQLAHTGYCPVSVSGSYNGVTYSG
jgi:hypothetical protein